MANNNNNIEEIKTGCYKYLNDITDSMKRKLDYHIDDIATAISTEKNISSNLKELCILTAILRDEERDLVGNLNAKSVSPAIKSQNRQLNKLINSIYARL